MPAFWKTALPLIGTGVILTAVASGLNFGFSKATIDGYMEGWIARNGYGGSTNMTLGILASNLLVYPVLNGIALIVALPVILGFHPEWGRRVVPAAALVLVPTLVIGALWWAGPRLFAIYTLPALALVAIPAGIQVWLGGRPAA